jgi:hypothetical protein
VDLGTVVDDLGEKWEVPGTRLAESSTRWVAMRLARSHPQIGVADLAGVSR